MAGLVRNEGTPFFQFIFNANGAIQVYSRTTAYIPQSSFFKIVYGPDGFQSVPLSQNVEEFFIGWSNRSIGVGQEAQIQIGGLVARPTNMVDFGKWLRVRKSGIALVDSAFRPANSFGCVHSRGMTLFPVMVREVENDA